MSDTTRDFFIDDANRIRREIRAKMPEGCEMDEMNWLELQRLRSMTNILLGKEPMPKAFEFTRIEYGSNNHS